MADTAARSPFPAVALPDLDLDLEPGPAAAGRDRAGFDDPWWDDPKPGVRAGPARSRAGARVRAGRLARRAALGLAVLAAALVVALVGLRLAYGGRVLPAVAVADVPVGGLERDAAEGRLRARAAALETGTVAFTHADRVWTPTLTELGASVDVDASLAAAYAVGREGGAVDRLRAQGELARADRQVPLRLRLDGATLEGWFDRVDADLGLAPRDAGLTVEGVSARVVPETEGVVVDREAARGRIVAALGALAPLAEPLPTRPTAPRVRAADLDGARAGLEAALARGVAVEFEGRSWTLAPADLGRFVVVRTDGPGAGAAAVSVALDEPALMAWLKERFAARVNRDPVDAGVGWDGGPVATSPSADGFRLRPEAFARDVAASFLGDHGPVPVPVKVLPPAVDAANLEALGLATLLGRGDSNYTFGTVERDTNVEVGTSLLNGTLVPPGGMFDFNRAIGEITADKGYVESQVVEDDRAGRDIGGGICQVSTTVFRAALRAGLPIEEWWPHTYRQKGYEVEGWGAGFDASILQPEGDPFGGGSFKFANPSPDAWLLVTAWADGTNVVVEIYGPDLGYDVRLTEPTLEGPIVVTRDLEVVDDELPPGSMEQTELPLDGWDVRFVRDVYDRDGALLWSRTFFVGFKGRANVWTVSPDMQGRSPANSNA